MFHDIYGTCALYWSKTPGADWHVYLQWFTFHTNANAFLYLKQSEEKKDNCVQLLSGTSRKKVAYSEKIFDMAKTSSWIFKISFFVTSFNKAGYFLFMFYKESDYVAETLNFLPIFDWRFCLLQKSRVEWWSQGHRIWFFVCNFKYLWSHWLE